jgi:hypothetical protein
MRGNPVTGPDRSSPDPTTTARRVPAARGWLGVVRATARVCLAVAPRWVRIVGGLVGILLTVVVAGSALWITHASGGGGAGTAEEPVPVSWGRPVVAAAELAQHSGVTITQVAVTGQGGLVDLRFKVVDPDLAASLHDEATPPALVEERTGLVVRDLLMGHAHNAPYETGVTYYLVFNNPGNWIHRGARVSVLLGDAQVDHVLVR